MSSPVDPPDLVLTQLLANGDVEWIPLPIPGRIEAVEGVAYALIDRADFEAPQALVARRRGDDLVLAVKGSEVLVIGAFFATLDAAFYPTTNVASGLGAFSATPITPESPVLAGSPEGEQIVWSAGSEHDPDAVAEEAPEESVPPTLAEVPGDGGSSPLLWAGVAAGGLGLLALAGGGGGGGGGGNGGGGGGIPPDTTPPQITSGATAVAIPDDSDAGLVVYTATATDASAVTYSLGTGGDEAAFSIDPNSGAVTLTEEADYATQPTYTFTVVATDAAGNRSEQAVTLDVVIDETAPVITSGATAGAIAENSGAGQVVYTATATDDTAVTYSLGSGGDEAAFGIDADTGAVTLTGDPDYETQSAYAFTVVATDAADNSSEQAVSLSIEDVDDAAPVITSSATASPIEENSGAGQVVYTVTATDDSAVTYGLGSGGDESAFSIDADTGAVTLTGDPDFETQPTYTFTVVATDAAGNSSAQAVSLAIEDLDDAAPVITSSATANPIDENSGAGQVVYMVTATDDSAVSYSLGAGGDSGAFSIDAISGAVTLTGDPDFETQPAYSFTVVATDAAGNSSELAVSLSINDIADETPPTLASSTPADDATAVLVNGDIVLTFSEAVQAGAGNVILSSAGDTRTIAVTDTSQVTINGNQVTINPADDLNGRTLYSVQIDNGALTDLAENAYAGISDATSLNFETGIDTSTVVFDLVQGSSSDHSGRIFQSDVSYDIYIRVDSNSAVLNSGGGGPGTWGTWGGATNLGSDDRVILVGSGAPVRGPAGPVDDVSASTAEIAWSSPFDLHAGQLQARTFTRVTGFFGNNLDRTALFDTAAPGTFLGGQGGQLSTMYFTAMPAGLLTSQGLV